MFQMLALLGVLAVTPPLVDAFTCQAPAISETARRAMLNAQRLDGTGAPTDAQLAAAANVQRVQRLFPAEKFAAVFPRANLGQGPQEGRGPYTYANFLRAVAKWPALCNDGGPQGMTGTALDQLCLKELATLFAMWAQEVGEHDIHGAYPEWQQALYHFQEMGCERSCPGYRGATCDPTTWQGQRWPCPNNGAEYFGRGAHQLSYNYNYGPFSEAVFNGDASILLANPGLVVSADSNGWLAFASAIWFYMTPQSPKPSGHDALVGWWTPNAADLRANRRSGFGIQIMIINGGVECGGPTPMAQAANRVTYYQAFCQYFNIPPGDNLQCTQMQQFGEDSSAALPTYWEQSWAWPETCACQLVTYQTSWSIYDNMEDLNDPYCKCVTKLFGPNLDANPICNQNASPAPSASALASTSPSRSASLRGPSPSPVRPTSASRSPSQRATVSRSASVSRNGPSPSPVRAPSTSRSRSPRTASPSLRLPGPSRSPVQLPPSPFPSRSLLPSPKAASCSVSPPALSDAAQGVLHRTRRLEGKGAPTDAQIAAAANAQRVQRLLPQTQFEALFSRANLGKGAQEGNGPYTYRNFLRAVAKWPALCNDGGPAGLSGAELDQLCLRELATLFAMWGQEVGEHNPSAPVPEWQQALYFYSEIGCEESGCSWYRGWTCDPNSWQGQRWPCPNNGASYFGRGAHQLSYNYNYGPFSEAMYDGDASVLLTNPQWIVSADANGWLAFASAIWFYMTPQSPKPSGHDAVVGWWVPNAADVQAGRLAGFGVQIMIINGGIECGKTSQQAANRITYYQEWCKYFGIAPGANLECSSMKNFDSSSSAALATYWERSWSAATCQLVSYQTGWSIFDAPANLDGPFCKCVANYFG